MDCIAITIIVGCGLFGIGFCIGLFMYDNCNNKLRDELSEMKFEILWKRWKIQELKHKIRRINE